MDLHSGNGSADISTSSSSADRQREPAHRGTEAGDNSATMTIGDFNGDGMNDIAIGAYGNDYSGDIDTGGGAVIYQSEFIFRDDFDDD